MEVCDHRKFNQIKLISMNIYLILYVCMCVRWCRGGGGQNPI